MTSISVGQRRPELEVFGITYSKVQRAAIWLMFATSFFVFVEPAPTDLIFIIALLLHLRSGLTVSATIMPMVFYLLIYNIGGLLSYIPVMFEPKTTNFMMVTAYMSLSGVFIAMLVAKNPLRNIAVIKNGWIIAAVIGSIIGIVGYFNVAGLGTMLSPGGRAQGTFKDPNVLSTFLILPALLIMQGFMLRIQKQKFLSVIALMIILGCWFLAFSRGAWVNLIASTLLTVSLTFMLTPSASLRRRIVLLTIVGTVVALMLAALLLTIPAVNKLFFDRLTLLQYYDAGEKGRFGNQLNSIPYLLQMPLGFGPLQFAKFFGADPHNTYINGFASFGWLGGIAYLVMVLNSIVVGFFGLMVRTPWQHLAIASFCVLFTTCLQGVQIDLEHWRHLHWLFGLNWGLFAASMAYVPPPVQTPLTKPVIPRATVRAP